MNGAANAMNDDPVIKKVRPTYDTGHEMVRRAKPTYDTGNEMVRKARSTYNTGNEAVRSTGRPSRSNVTFGGSFAPLGMGIKSKKGGALAKAVESIQQFTGISGAPGLDALNANQTRMAKVRSHIGQNRLS